MKTMLALKVPGRSAPILVALAAIALAACEASVAPLGGSGSGAAAGATCIPESQGDVCGVANGSSAALHCDAGGKVWLLKQLCPAGTFCSATTSGLTCIGTAVVGADSGEGTADATAASDALADSESDALAPADAADFDLWAADAPKTDFAVTDFGSAPDFGSAADTGKPCGVCAPGMICDSKSNQCVKAPNCGGLCTAGQTCDATSNTCVQKPCGGACKGGETCDAGSGKCFVPCGGPCKVGETCDTSSNIFGFCKGYTAPTSWGVGGSGAVQKVTKLAISAKNAACDIVNASGQLGMSDGVGDNALAGASSLIGSNLQDAVKKGSIVLLFEPKSYSFFGSPFTFNVLTGSIDPSDTAHDPTTAGGKYTVNPSSYDLTQCTPGSCPAYVKFTGATIKAGTLSATASQFFLNLSISSIGLALTLQKVTLTGQVLGEATWTSTTAGRLCGYVTETDLSKAIDALPPDVLAQFGGVDAVKKLIPTLIKSDVDSDGDGVKDAKSVSLDLETLGGTVTGMTAP